MLSGKMLITVLVILMLSSLAGADRGIQCDGSRWLFDEYVNTCKMCDEDMHCYYGQCIDGTCYCPPYETFLIFYDVCADDGHIYS